MNLEQSTTKEALPKDFPIPTVFTEDQVKERQSKKVELPYDEYNFYFKDGQLDKEWINNMWYALRGKTGDMEYAKPEDIEIKSFGQFLYDHISFREIFEQSSAFQEMMSRSNDDSKQQQVINYLTDMVIRTFSAELRQKIAKIPELSEKISTYLKGEIQNAMFSYREKDKWAKKIDSGQEEPEEIKQIRAMREENHKLEHEIQEILTKEKLW